MADGDVVRRITISATGEGIDSTKASVDGLSSSVSNLTDAQSAWNDALAGFGSSFGGFSSLLTGGVIAGLAGMLDYVVKSNSALAEMATTANQVGLTLKDFQSIQFGGAIAGLSTDQINTGLSKSAELLNDASRNSNTLSKELDANGISIKNANGQLISQNQLLGIAANLVANAKNPGDQLAIAQMLGFTKEWIPLLEQGSSALTALGPAAQAAGAIIDDATIKRASDFDAEWRKSSVEFSSYMKASLADLLPIVDDLIQRAAKFVASIHGSDINAALNSQLKTGADAAGLPDSAVIHIDADPLSKATEQFQNSPVFSVDTWMNLGRALYAGFKVMSPEQASAEIPGYAASQIKEPTYPTQNQMDKAFGMDWDAQSKAIGAMYASLGNLGQAFSVVAGRAKDANDAVDRAVNTLSRHVEQTKADTLAIGLGDGALASFRATAAETAAKLANGGVETDKQAASFAALKVQAESAADALAKAKIASEISRGSQTAFLSQDDVQIANQLKTLYGDDIPAALASSEAAALRVNKAMSDINTLTRTSAVSFATTFVNGIEQGKSAMDALRASATQLSTTLTNAAFTNLLNGNYVTAGVEAVAAIGSYIFGSSGPSAAQQAANKAQSDQAAQMNADAATRQLQDQYDAANAGLDTSTLNGQLQAFDLQAQQQRLAEAQKGDGAIVELEQSLAAQRLAIIQKSNAAITQTMNDFLNSVKTGSQSILSPADQLAYEQNLFNTQLSGAKTGDSTDLNALTTTASALLTLAQNFYASGTGYADTYKQVTDAITALAANPNQSVYADPNVTGITADNYQTTVKDSHGDIVNATMSGMAEGGIVGNGLFNKDSVIARYAGGGSIALAGGEAVTRATSVNANTIGMLNHINRTGQTPKQDNSDVVRVLTQGFNGQTVAIVTELRALSGRIGSLEDTTRIASNKRRTPGTMAA